MHSRFRTLVATFVVALAAIASVPAHAQGPADPQRLRDAIDLTDRRIQQAQDLLVQSPQQQAAGEVDQAVSLQALAKRAFSDGRYPAAGRATFDARFHADRAIALLRGLPDPGRVQDQLARTREVIDRGRDRIAHCELPVARDLLRTAIDMQARAEQAYGETRYLAALQLTMSARERALRALQLCSASESFDETVAMALQRTDEVLARAHDALDAGGSDRARQLLANADSLQSRARSEDQAGHPRLALRFTRMAREQADRALRGGSPSGRR